MNTHNGISGGTKKIVDALANFGEKANSVVKIKRYSAGETFKHSILSDRNVWYSVIDPVKVKAMFDTKPDIVLTGAYVDTSNPDIATYTLNYLKAGGVLILALQQESFAKTLFTKMYPAYTITTSGTGQNSYQIANTDDEITNGPFGNIMGKYWGNDWTNSIAVSGLPQSDIIVYSRNQEGYPIMFRHRTYNLIFIGDGGVFSNYNGTAGANAGSGSANIHPLAFDDNCKPITRTGWDTYWNTHPDRVENARLFANIMAWAVKQAETNGINRPK
jgi:hypothetical protein